MVRKGFIAFDSLLLSFVFTPIPWYVQYSLQFLSINGQRQFLSQVPPPNCRKPFSSSIYVFWDGSFFANLSSIHHQVFFSRTHFVAVAFNPMWMSWSNHFWPWKNQSRVEHHSDKRILRNHINKQKHNSHKFRVKNYCEACQNRLIAFQFAQCLTFKISSLALSP